MSISRARRDRILEKLAQAVPNPDYVQSGSYMGRYGGRGFKNDKQMNDSMNPSDHRTLKPTTKGFNDPKVQRTVGGNTPSIRMPTSPRHEQGSTNLEAYQPHTATAGRLKGRPTSSFAYKDNVPWYKIPTASIGLADSLSKSVVRKAGLYPKGQKPPAPSAMHVPMPRDQTAPRR